MREAKHVLSDVAYLSVGLNGVSFPALRDAGVVDTVSYCKGEPPGGFEVARVPWSDYEHGGFPNSDLDELVACAEDLVLKFVRGLPRNVDRDTDAIAVRLEDTVYEFVKKGPVHVYVFSEPEISVRVPAAEAGNLLYSHSYQVNDDIPMLDQVLETEAVHRSVERREKKSSGCLAMTLKVSFEPETSQFAIESVKN